MCLSLFRVLPNVTFTHSSSYILDGLDSMHSTSSIDITHLEHTAQAQCNFLLSISHDNLQFREFSRSSSMHIHILCTTECQLLETQVTVCCCIPLLTVLTKRSLFASFSYCLQFNILESHTSHFCWHILQCVFLVIKIVQKTSVLYYSVFCCIFTVNVIALLNCKKRKLVNCFLPLCVT